MSSVLVREAAGAGQLVLAGAPLGNPADASPRLRAELAAADVVAAEDTRRLARLVRDLDVRPGGRVVAYFEANEVARTPELIATLLAGDRVLLITDGGMPSVSDPGRHRRGDQPVAGAVCGHHRAGGQWAGLRPVLLRGVPAAPTRRAAVATGRAGRRAAHAGVLRGPAPAGGGAGRPGRRVRRRPPGRGLPGTDQDLRGGTPGAAC